MLEGLQITKTAINRNRIGFVEYEYDFDKQHAKLLQRVVSSCPECGKIVNAEVYEFKNQVFMYKECCGHKFTILKEKDAEFYHKWKGYSESSYIPPQISLDEMPRFVDHISSIMLNITERCNTFCGICVVNSNVGAWRGWENFWTLEKIRTFLDAIKDKKRLIQLSGGEPTIRNDFNEIVKLVVESGNIPYAFTNGIKFADKKFAEQAKKAGLTMIHFTLDSLNPNVNAAFNGGGKWVFDEKMKALENLRENGFKVYASCKIARGINDIEIGKLLEWTVANNDYVSGITFRPFSPQGRFMLKIKEPLTLSELVKMAEYQTNGLITREYLLEFRRFRFNGLKVMRKLLGKKTGRDMGLNHYLDCVLQKRGGKLQQVISLERLKKLNDAIESVITESKGKIVITLAKNLDWQTIKVVASVASNAFNFSKMLSASFNKDNFVRVVFSELSNQINADFTEKFACYTMHYRKNMREPILMAAHVA